MLAADVHGEIALDRTPVIAVGARKGFLVRVGADVLDHVRKEFHLLTAQLALVVQQLPALPRDLLVVRLLIHLDAWEGMRPSLDVLLEFALRLRPVLANGALKRPLVRVDTEVPVVTTLPVRPVPALPALKPLPRGPLPLGHDDDVTTTKPRSGTEYEVTRDSCTIKITLFFE